MSRAHGRGGGGPRPEAPGHGGAGLGAGAPAAGRQARAAHLHPARDRAQQRLGAVWSQVGWLRRDRSIDLEA